MANGWVVFEAPEDGKMVVGIDPGVSGSCPGDLVLAYGYNGVPLCTRVSTAAGSVAADIDAPFDLGSVTVDITCAPPLRPSVPPVVPARRWAAACCCH